MRATRHRRTSVCGRSVRSSRSDRLVDPIGCSGRRCLGPSAVLLIGRIRPEFAPGRSVALAMETDLTHWLSSDPDEGQLTMRLRLVGAGSSAMLIRRVLLVIYTSRHDNADSDS